MTVTHGQEADRRQMTYGERLVGLNFNPSGDAKVARFKTLFAAIIDICSGELLEIDEDDANQYQGGLIWREAIMRSLDAQMWTVKAATWRNADGK